MGGSRGANSAPVAPVAAGAKEGTGPGLSPPPASGGERDPLTPHPLAVAPLPPGPPGLARLGARVSGAWVVGPQVGGGASTQCSRRCRALACRRRPRTREGLGSRVGPP